MQITWRTTQGTQKEKPHAIDTTSSPSTVYLRKNISQVNVKSGEETIKAWQYDEAQLTLEEYAQYQAELEECSTLANKERQENDEVIMEAIADTYMQQLEIQENQMVLMEAIADIYSILGEGV